MIAAITFDIWKDLVIFFSLRHYIVFILEDQLHFDFIGNYDLNIISWYILAIAILSQVSMSTYAVAFMINNKERFQTRIGTFKWTILTILALIFPTHFSCLLTLVQKISYARQQNGLKEFLQSVEDRLNISEFETQREDIIPELSEIAKPELSHLFSELRIPLLLEVLEVIQWKAEL